VRQPPNASHRISVDEVVLRVVGLDYVDCRFVEQIDVEFAGRNL